MSFSPRAFRSLWPEFLSDSWAGWNSIEDAVFGLEPSDPAFVRRVTGRSVLPTTQVSEVYLIVGRGGGKSRWAARLAVYFAVGRVYKCAPGERIYVGVFAPDRKQAAITLRYVTGLLHAEPALERMIARETAESVDLNNGVTLEVITASKAAPRGRAYALAIVEETAFLPQDQSAEPATELLRALRPALARVPDSLLASATSPHAKSGPPWEMHRKYFGNNESAAVLVVQADTLSLNPTFDQREIARAYAEDPSAAAAEYGAQFRNDVETFVAREAVEACVVPGRLELPPLRGVRYAAFVDPSGGSVDSFTLAIGHTDLVGPQRHPVAVLDALRERRPPFSPEGVVEEFAALLKSYGVEKIVGDRYAGEWPREAFRRAGITYEPAEMPKSDLYKNALAIVNGGRLELLDHSRLVSQFCGLERRTARGGKDSIDHAPSAHDDLANVVAGLAVRLAVQTKRKDRATWGRGPQIEEPPTPPRPSALEHLRAMTRGER